MSLGFCYAVMYSNGVVKFGRAEDIYGRIRDHESSGRAFGISVDLVFFTYQIKNYKEAEIRMLNFVKSRGCKPTKGGEFFSDISVQLVRDAMSHISSQYVECLSVKNSNDSSCLVVKINPYTISGRSAKGLRSPRRLSERIIESLKKLGDSSQAVIANRVRGNRLDLSNELSRMVAAGELKCATITHPQNGKKVVKYSIP